MNSPFHKRILKEVAQLRNNGLPNVNLISFENDKLKLEIIGAESTIYEKESFILLFTLSKNYPIEAPEVIFIEKIPENEHVYSNGHICLSILYDQWSPALTVESVCLSIISLLSSASAKKKPINDRSYCSASRNKSPKDFKWSYHK